MDTTTQTIEKKIKLNLQHNFTQDEILHFSKELAKSNQELDRLEKDKKATQSDYNAQIDHQKSTIGMYSNKINNGKEMRLVECKVELHTPQDGIKTITRLDTMETHEETMTQDDYQLF